MGNCKSSDAAWFHRVDASSPEARRSRVGHEQSFSQDVCSVPLRSSQSSFADSTTHGFGHTNDDYSIGPGGGLATISSKGTADDRAYLDLMLDYQQLTENHDDGFAPAPPLTQEDPEKNCYHLAEPLGFQIAQCSDLTTGYSENYHLPPPPPLERGNHHSHRKLSIDRSPSFIQMNSFEIKTGNKGVTNIEEFKLRHNGGTSIDRDAHDDADEDGNLILHHACIWGANADLIKELLESNPEAIYVKNKRGETPLHIARKDERKSHIVSIIERFESQKRIEVLKRTICSSSDGSIDADRAGGFSNCAFEEKSSTLPRSEQGLPPHVLNSHIQLRAPVEEISLKPFAFNLCDTSVHSNENSVYKAPPSLAGTDVDNYSPRSLGKHSACSTEESSVKSPVLTAKGDIVKGSPSSHGTSSASPNTDLSHKVTPMPTDIEIVDHSSRSRSMSSLYLPAGSPYSKTSGSKKPDLVAYAPRTLRSMSVHSFSDESFMTTQSRDDLKIKHLEEENSDLKHEMENLTDKLDGLVRAMEKMVAAQRFLIEQQSE